ncbi:hypothetical protein ID866_1157 [Astraeus odoratus]|nr:hypothetical protein ID866_1157 [Astraeus odoratus]
MLSVNLLSSYLPPPQHPDYAKRLEQLPAYRESLHIRYPPVCAQCLPAVEDEIKRKDHMARTQALGGFLKETRGKARQRQVSGTMKDGEKSRLAIWRLRGALWWITLLYVVTCHCAVMLDYSFPPVMGRMVPSLPVISFVSLLYTAWDPTYYSFKRARIQGRDVRVRGKGRYIALQLTVWFSRLLTSVLLTLPRYAIGRDHLHLFAYPSSYRLRMYCSISLALEITVFITSFAILHLQRPPTIRLIDTSSHTHIQALSARTTPEFSDTTGRSSSVPIFPTTAEPDLTALTLSSKPTLIVTNPIFGTPSLLSTAGQKSTSPMKVDDGHHDEDAMDWSPTEPSQLKPRPGKGSVNDDDGSWLRPQKFFPPEQPTGLETLFASTKLDDGDNRLTGTARKGVLTRWSRGGAGDASPNLISPLFWQRLGTVTVVLALLCAVAYQGWTKWNIISLNGHVIGGD